MECVGYTSIFLNLWL